MLKKSLIEKIESFGGKINNSKSNTLEECILFIKFNKPLFFKPEFFPWPNDESLHSNDFFDNDKCCGQLNWTGSLFTPMNEFTKDYEEMSESYSFDKDCLKEIINETNNPYPDFIELFYSCFVNKNNRAEGIYYYICTSDKNYDNPFVYSTTEDCFFCELNNEGTLELFLNKLME